MPSPRQIALATNDRSAFEDTAEKEYSNSAGVPGGASAEPKPVSYAANPTNPPEKPAPAKNLKGG